MYAILRNVATGVSRTKPLHPFTASLATAAWIVTVDNWSFWGTFVRAQGSISSTGMLAAAGLVIVLILSFATVLRLVAFPRLGLIVLPTFLLISAGVAHYLDVWGVLFDKGLIRSLVETDVREAKELFSWPAFADLAVRGMLPAAVLWIIGIRASSAAQTAAQTMFLAVAAAVATAAVLATSYGVLAATFRNHREMRLQLVPTNFLNAIYGHLKGREVQPTALRPLAPDAKRAMARTGKPLVMILIVGETARAANFSLGTYPRDTNGELANLGVVYFNNVVACGTDTATSLPCMFSGLGVDGFSVSKARANENTLDVLERTGVEVEWLENNSGCKGVCARVPTRQMPTSGDANLCAEDSCYDEILIRELAIRLKDVNRDKAFVLHQMGSHGPSYYKRYPPPGKYLPTCETNRIQKCEKQALINTYDNTIWYTSKVIAMAIAAAREHQASIDLAVLYISDHGESLGERNVYLHGLPPILAPREQMAVPMIAWLPSNTQDRLGLAPGCIASLADQAHSHDNLSHTLLGFFSVQTTFYRSDLDLFSASRRSSLCRKSP